MGSSPNDPLPPSSEKLFTLEHYRALEQILARAIERLEALSIRVPMMGRLRRELAALRNVTATGLPKTKAKQVVLANAASDALDYHDIVSFLGDHLGAVAADLQRSMRGSEDGRHSRREPERFQAQLWLGSVLAKGGYEPRVPPPGPGRRPDFLIDEILTPFGAEVKRPQTRAGALAKLKDAARQLVDADVAGAVLMDLSDAVGLQKLAWCERDVIAPKVEAAYAQFASLEWQLREAVLDTTLNGFRRGFENVVVLFSLARTAVWVNGEPSGLAVVAMAGAHSFVRRLKNLRYHQSISINKRIIIGLNAAGFAFEPFASVAVPSFPGWRV